MSRQLLWLRRRGKNPADFTYVWILRPHHGAVRIQAEIRRARRLGFFARRALERQNDVAIYLQFIFEHALSP